MQRYTRIALLIILAFVAAQLANARADSPTADEQAYIARGLVYLRTGDLSMFVGHPPLVLSLAALPLVDMESAVLPFDSNGWAERDWLRFGRTFMWESSNDPDLIIFLCRVPIILLAALLGALVFRFGREVAGPAAGLAALAAFALDPNMAAHSRLVTTDLGVTALLLAATYAWRRMAKQSARGWTLAAGLALGLALVSKFTALLWVPVLALLYLAGTRREKYLRLLAALAFACVTAWAVYRFELRPSPLLGVDFPLPAARYWEEIGWQFQWDNTYFNYYLLGELSHTGWWYYFPVAMLVKTPVPLLAGGAVGLAVWWKRKKPRDGFLVVPPVVYFFSTFFWSRNIGYRYLLPLLPHIYLLAGMAFAWAWQRGGRARALAAVGMAWLTLGAALIYPHHISYFNALAGGPANGHRFLADSNIDWGQDMARLGETVQAHELNPVYLDHVSGVTRPTHYGIEDKGYMAWEPRTPVPEPGWYALSINSLLGITRPWNPDAFAYFRRREPDMRVAYSFYLYYVPVDAPPALR